MYSLAIVSFLSILDALFRALPPGMATHFLTLAALSRELDPQLRSSTIQEIFTQNKNELIISVGRSETGSVASTDPSVARSPAGGESAAGLWLHISVDPKLNYFFAAMPGNRAKRNSVNLFDLIIGSTIESIAVRPFDRTLTIALRKNRFIVIQLYGSAASNIFLTDETTKILDAFKSRKTLIGTTLMLGEDRFDPSILDDRQRFRDAVKKKASKTALAALKAVAPVLGPILAREPLHRSGISEQTLVADLRDTDLDRLYAETRGIFAAPLTGGARIYSPGDEQKILSVTPLRHLPEAGIEKFPSVNEAIRRFVMKTSRSRTFGDERAGLEGAIRSDLERSRRSLQMVETQLAAAGRGEEFERLGKLILANINRIGKGTRRINLSDPAAGEETVSLDPALTPARNAEEYFQKARKARLALTASGTRAGSLRRKVALLESMLLELDRRRTPEQLSDFRKEYTKTLKNVESTEKNPQEERLPFRIFEIAGGFQVLVGKSSANNDLLTSKYAKPNDLWFHARGASGSHTVLKAARGREVPREAIRAGASIAAYYSKMRNASNVPVAYCERKYVRKPKGAPPGTVSLEREQIIFVQPRLP